MENGTRQQPNTGMVPMTGEAVDAPLNLPQGKSSVPVQLGIAPRTLEEGWRLAQMMARSSLVPKNFREHPEDVLVAIQLGIEIGLAPMQSLQSIAVINGRPSVWGDGFLALIMASPSYADHDEYYEVDGRRVDGLTAEDLKKDSTAAVCTFHRKGKATPTTQKFTIAMAKKASLLGKEGPWGTYPDRMLKMRARSWAGRDAFPDVLRGITTAEEAQDTPLDPPPARVLPMTAPQRLSQPAPAAASTAAAPPVEPNGGEPSASSTPASETPFSSAGVLIRDVIVGEDKQTALVIDEHGTQYGTDDRSIILAAVTAKEKGYRMEISAVRRGDESIIEEINMAQEAVGK